MHILLKTTTAALAGLIAAQAVAADDLTVVSFGGANKVAQIKAFYAPWEQYSSSKVIAGEYNGEMARLKVMVDSRSVGWDVVEVEMPELARGCDEGLFESLPEELFGSPSHYVSGAIQPCGVGFFIWSTVLAYNADKLAVAPTGWADFWDLRKYSGKRGLHKTAKFTLEFALIADGVPPAEVGAQPAQYLMSGDMVMSAAYNGRISAAQKESNLKVVWAGGGSTISMPGPSRKALKTRRRPSGSLPSRWSQHSNSVLPRLSPTVQPTLRLFHFLTSPFWRAFPSLKITLANRCRIVRRSGLTMASHLNNGSMPGRPNNHGEKRRRPMDASLS